MSCYVYFIATRGMVLIEAGERPKSRRAALQPNNPWPLVLVGRESHQDAGAASKRCAELHEMCKYQHIHDGWFHISGALMQVIDASLVPELSLREREQAFFSD